MVLRAEAVRERLLKLEETVSRLAELATDTAPGQRSFRDDWAAERGLQLAAETVFDVGNHILSAHFGLSAADYDDIIDRLGETGVIGASLRERLRGLGGFRNVLVHGYLRIDRARVWAYVAKAPAEFSEFAQHVRRWLEGVVK